MSARERAEGDIAPVPEGPGRRREMGDLDAAETFAVEQARLRRDEQRADAVRARTARGVQRLHAIISDIASAFTSEKVAEVVLEHGVAGIGVTSAAIWHVEPDGKHARVLRSEGYPAATLERFSRISIDDPDPLTDAMKWNEPVFIRSQEDYEHRYPLSAARDRDVTGGPARAFVCLPLVVHQETIGALVFAFEGDRRLDDDEHAFLTLIVDHCAQGLYRSRLYEAEQQARLEMALLYALVDAVSRAETLEDVYQPALSAVQRALRVERSSILLYDTDGMMRFKAWRGLSDAYRKAVEGHSPWTRDTRNPPPLVVSDVERDSSLEEYLPVFRAEGIRALGFLPVVHAGKLLGKFMVYSPHPRAFSDDDLRLARTIGSQVAQAVARKLSEAEVARLYAEAEAARRAAENASRMKDEFLAVISHELRTPLSAIFGWSRILKGGRGTDPASVAKGLDIIERNAKAQSKIVEDMLDVSRAITGKLVIDPRPVSLVTVVDEALDSVKASAEAKEIRVTCDASEDHYTVVGDPERLRQILWNLLSNAVKFTPRSGRVEVRLRRALGAIVVEVQDTGMGIEAKFLPFVFDRFRQADSSMSRKHGGLGLGLSIVRHLVELHGGQVRAESSGVSQGSKFTITFPVKAIFSELERPFEEDESSADDTKASFPLPAGPAVDLTGIRVLLVDDEADARDVLQEVLVGFGAAVEMAESAGHAIEAVTRFLPDAIVSDIGMPDEDGYALLRRVQNLPAPHRYVPVVALTAYASPEDARKATMAGFVRHMPKPTDPDALAKAILEAHTSAKRRPLTTKALS